MAGPRHDRHWSRHSALVVCTVMTALALGLMAIGVGVQRRGSGRTGEADEVLAAGPDDVVAGHHVAAWSHGTERPGGAANSEAYNPDAKAPSRPYSLSSALTHVPAGWAASTHSLVSGDRVRTYLMVRPPVGPTPLPVVVMLHGRGMSPAGMERYSALLPDLGPAIAVYPAGWDRSWNAGGCCGIAHRTDVNDVAFIEDLVHQVTTSQPDAEASRVYLVGFSNGGRMAYQMACQDPGAFAGLAAVEAVPVSPCPGTTPLPTLIVASTGDPLLSIPVDGRRKVMQGFVEPTVGQTVSEWRRIDGCAAAPRSATVGQVTATMWPSCRSRGRLEYAQYQGGHHSWPKGNATTPPAQALVANFLWGPHPAVMPTVARSTAASSH